MNPLNDNILDFDFGKLPHIPSINEHDQINFTERSMGFNVNSPFNSKKINK